MILYGREYLAAQWPLTILIWSTGASMIGNVRNIWIVAEGCERYTKYFSYSGAVFNALLNYFFIKKWGIIGASITTLISQIFVSIFAPIFFKDTRPFITLFLKSFSRMNDLLYLCKKIISVKKS